MVRSTFLGFLLSTLLLEAAASCVPPNEASAGQATHSHDPTGATVFGERLLLFVEHPHLVRGVPARFLAHLTVLDTGEPVRSGTVTLEIGSTRLTVAAPRREGLFIPEGSFPESGTFASRLVVTSDQAEETIALGQIVVHADEVGAEKAAHAAEADDPVDAVPFLMEPQWKVRLLVAEAVSKRLRTRHIVPASVVVPEGKTAVVSSPVAGRIVVPVAGQLPKTGETVAAGDTLAFVVPPLGAMELAQLHALELELDLKALDALSAIGEAETKSLFAEKERERIGKLRAESLSTQQQMEMAEENLALSKSQLDAARRMKDAVDRLVESRRASTGGEPAQPVRFPLAAPIAGRVVEVRSVPGSSVESGATLFRILDTSRLWIEGRVSEFDLGLLSDAPTAVAHFAALPERRYALTGAHEGKPYLGAEVDPTSRTLLVRFELENSDGSVRPGMLADLSLAIGERDAAVAIPSDAVLMDQGLPTAYVMLEGELFQKRDLELGVRDDAWVEVLRGIERGERVAARGAHFVKLAALSPASFGAGHAH